MGFHIQNALLSRNKKLRLEVELTVKRLKNKPIVVYTPDQAEKKLRASLDTEHIRTMHEVAKNHKATDEDTLIYFYECLQCDYLILNMTTMEKYGVKEYAQMVFFAKVVLPYNYKQADGLATLTTGYYLGYPVSILLQGTAHERFVYYPKLQELADRIRKTFRVR